MATRASRARGRRPQLERASPIPLYIQIEEEIRGSIDSGQIGELARVPSEIDLAAQFQVSRMTARKALDRLVGDGILFRRAGKGTFVAHPKIAHGPSQKVSFSAAMRSLGLRLTTSVLDSGVQRAPSHIARALELAAGSNVVFLRRLRTVAGEPAAIHTSYLPPQFSSVLEGDLTGSLTQLMIRAGARVAEAKDTIEAVAAAGDEAELLGVRAGTPLILIEGVAYSSTGQPLRYTSALYRGGRFRFTVDTSRPAQISVEALHESASEAAGSR
ncbi:MAG TPA: GntR family transcriptional regulator, partial [Candidatus Limnocylindria bacterium]|nr:GntR family transcriptional regulator [Candidatus Limnocylindria bacterium]